MPKVRKEMPKQKEEKAVRPGISAFLKKPKHMKTKSEKIYRYIGFYDRLKAIDVKHSHATMVDHSLFLDNVAKNDLDDDPNQSNFVALLQAEKTHNATLEYKRCWKELEPLALSFPLVVLNKDKIVAILVRQLLDDSFKMIQSLILSLLVALVKDLRHDVYAKFMHEVLPAVIQVLDGQDLKLLDSVFQLLSFSFKYLLKPIREDIVNFYSIYSELLCHPSRYVRKFSSQSFSYILRKVRFTPEITKMVCSSDLFGSVELLFEVCAGDCDQLHSKAEELISGVLQHAADNELLVRYLYLKLVNAVDTKKQMPLFQWLFDAKLPVKLTTQILDETIRFKWSKSVTPELAAFFLKWTVQNNMSDQILVAKTMSLLYYFQYKPLHESSIFTHQLFQMTEQAIGQFFKILELSPEQITLESDLDINKILDMKQPSQYLTQFSVESHQEKCSQLLKSLNKWTLKNLSIANIARLLTLIERSGQQDLRIQVGGRCVLALNQLISEASADLDLYTLAKFVRIVQDNSTYLQKLETKIPQKNNRTKVTCEFDLSSHQVLKGYQTQGLSQCCLTIFDLYNRGYLHQVTQASQALIRKTALTEDTCSSLFHLKQALTQLEAPPQALFTRLCENLCKNSRELRLLTLRVLCLYERLDFIKPDLTQTKLDSDTIKEYYTGPCDLVKILLQAEEYPVGLQTEKQKLNLLRRATNLVHSELIPQEYVEMCYRYAIGCFWVKFTPLHEAAHDLISEVLCRHNLYIEKQLHLVEQLNYLLHLGGDDNDKILATVQQSIPLSQMSSEKHPSSGLFLGDVTAAQDFMQTREFYINQMKALHLCVDYLFVNKTQSQRLVEMFDTFLNVEFYPLTLGRRLQVLPDFKQTVVASNVTDSQEFKDAKRVSHLKLGAFCELLSKSASYSKLSNAQSVVLIDHWMNLLETTDDKLQQALLTCLQKVTKREDFANKTVKFPKYQKLFEGLMDDTRFVDMIPIINFGSQAVSNVEENADIEVYDDSHKPKKKTQEGIPRLAQSDRLEVLPVIVKLLFSKLLKKHGAINQKTLHQRRTIVYQFLSGLDPQTEYQIFFTQLLEPLGLTAEHAGIEKVREKLTLVSFNTFLRFIGTVEVVFAQCGSLLNRDCYLRYLSEILVLILAQAKRFTNCLKEDSEADANLYEFVGEQCKTCIRKGLKIVKTLYSKFSQYEAYIQHLTTLFYTEILQSEVQFFRQKYVSERAQLVEIVTTHWSAYCLHNYQTYPQVLPSLMQMLLAGNKVESQVFSLHLTMLKNIVAASISNDNERIRVLQQTKAESESDVDMSEDDNEDDDTMRGLANQTETAKQILEANVQCICQGLYAFWNAHSHQLKHALGSKSKGQKHQNQSKVQIKNSIAIANAVKDLTFILSELSSYLKATHSDKDLVNSFLEMMVSLMNQKQLLQAQSSFHERSKHEELLMFGCKAITSLLGQDTDSKTREKISEMFLHMRSKKARELLANGLHTVYNTETTRTLVQLNSVKKGVADVDYDYEKVLAGIKEVSERQSLSEEQKVLLFSVLALLTHQEYSVREYSLHAVSQLVPQLDERLFKQCETFVISTLKKTRDEMTMKSLLQALRVFVVQENQYQSQSRVLKPLINTESEDFFTQILSIQLQQRLKCLRKLQAVDIAPNVFQKAILPIVDYLIFDMKNQQENRRNTVRYSRDQSNLLQDEALGVYKTYAQKLPWSQYMSLVRKLLYKIEKATRAQNGVAAQKNDSLVEKIVCKCLCKVLEGFNFPDVPDAVETLRHKAEDKVAHKFEVVEYSDFLKDMIGDSLKISQEEREDDVELSSSEDEDNVKMSSDKVEDIQSKLLQKVLPLLQRHLLQTKGEHKTIRAHVAVAIAQVVRKLPVDKFTVHLQRLINHIVVKGLREKELNTREKARKALLRVIEEVSPRFIAMILQEMGNNLTRGYQLHVYLYTVHYIFNMLKTKIVVGQITNQTIKLLSPLLLREMFGDLMEERQATNETAKKHIKESKAQKAMPIYEVFAQYIDFKKSFVELIQPIVKVLEENPAQSAVQQTEDLLQRIANSVLKNTSISGPNLLPFLKQIIEKGVSMSMRLKINDEKAKRDYGAKPQDNAYVQKSIAQQKLETHEVQIKWTKTSELVGGKKTQEICGRVLANFGLQTLKKALNQKGLILQGDEYEERESKQITQKQDLIDLMDPFVQPLLDTFKTFYNPIIVQTLHILIHVIHMGLPTFKVQLRKFMNRIFKLFDTSTTTTDAHFTASLFKCTAELIKTYSIFNDLSETQLKTLVELVKVNLQNFQTQTNVFICLKAIIRRKFYCADIYDLMTSVQELMVTSVEKSTRSACAQIFVTFIMEYPMETQRLDTHMQHLLKNLTYFDAEGRLVLLETLKTLIERMPEEQINSWLDLIFLTLFLRLVNESSTKCREMVSLILKRLVTKFRKSYIDTVFQMNNHSEHMTNGKLQLLSIMADCGKLQKYDVERCVDLLASLIKDAAQKALAKPVVDETELENFNPEQQRLLEKLGLASDDEPQEQEESQQDQWSTTYFGIVCLENIFAKCDQSRSLIVALKKHETLRQDIVSLAWKSENYWVRLSALRVISGMLENQGLNIQKEDEPLKFMYKMLSVFNFSYVTEALCQEVTKNLNLAFGMVQADDKPKVFKKASYIGRRILGDVSDQSSTKQSAILDFYKTSIQQLCEKGDAQLLAQCCQAMLELVYRTYTDEQLKASVRDQSTELVDTMSNNLDKDVFITLFNQVQMAITQTRTERKLKDKMLVTTQQGLQKLAERRTKKLLKKKTKHKQRVLMNQLTR